MAFENSPMGMKFYNVQIPALVRSIEKVGEELAIYNKNHKDNIEQQVKNAENIKIERYKDLINAFIGHISAGEKNSVVIKYLLWLGFIPDELVNEFNFNSSDVMEAEQNMDDFDGSNIL